MGVTNEEILTAIAPMVDEMQLFVVELTVAPNKTITLDVDGMENVSIQQCVKIAKFLRAEFEEALDDYEITVSSPGLDEPFRHFNQFIKNTGKSVELLLNDGRKLQGKLVSASEESGIELQEFIEKKTKAKAAKPKLSETVTSFGWPDIKQTKKLVII